MNERVCDTRVMLNNTIEAQNDAADISDDIAREAAEEEYWTVRPGYYRCLAKRTALGNLIDTGFTC